MLTWFLADVCKFIEEDGIVVEKVERDDII
jgi:hypothetical protein